MLVNAVKTKFPEKKNYILERIVYSVLLINAASYLFAICIGKTIVCGLEKAAYSWSAGVISPFLFRSMRILSEPYTEMISG